MSASSQRLYAAYPTSLYTLDDDQFSIPSPDREMSSARSLSSPLSDVPEEDPASLAASGPYVNHSAANSASTFHGGGGGAGTSRSRTTTSGGQLQQRTPSIRTLGRTSTDPVSSPPSGTTPSSSSNVRRAQSSGSTTNRVGGSRSSTSASADRTLRKYRSTPRLPHDRDVDLAPSTAMYWSRAPVWGHLPSRTMRAHSVTLVDTTAWLYGGCDDKDSSKDVYCFDTGLFFIFLLLAYIVCSYSRKKKKKKQCNGRTQIQSATYHRPAERTPPRSSIRRSSCLAGGSGQCTTTPLTFSTPPLDAGHDPPSSLGRTQPHGEPTQPYFIKAKYGYLAAGTG